MKIGSSLTLCIADIIKGVVQLDEVEVIYANTCIYNRKEAEKKIELFSMVYWDYNPEEGIATFWKLWEERKIIQPRVLYGNKPCNYLQSDSKRWFNSVEEFISEQKSANKGELMQLLFNLPEED